MTDRDLLIAFQQSRSHDFFAHIVHRHASLVYAHARRLVKNQQLAEDIAQEVFLTLFREAANINPQVPLVGWLFITTRHRSLEALRAAARRHTHERKAAMSHEASHEPDPTWNLIAEDVDDAVAELTPDERHAILLRYFAGKTHHEIATELSISDEAAKKRVQRAVESLRQSLTTRGTAIPATALAATLSAHAAAEAAPATLAATITTAATLIPATAITTAKGVAILMTLTKTQIVAAIAALVAIVAIPVGILAIVRPSLPSGVSPDASAPVSAGPATTSDALTLPAEYALGEGQVLKWIPNAPARDREQALLTATTVESFTHRPSTAFILFPNKSGPPNWKCTFDEPFSLTFILRNCLDAFPQEVEGDPGNLLLLGDWVCNLKSSAEERRTAMEGILQNEIHQPMNLIYRDVPREVIVLKGTWSYTSPQPRRVPESVKEPFLEIYESPIKTTLTGSVSTGDGTWFSRDLGSYLRQQVFVEAEGIPNEIMWDFNDDPKSPPQHQGIVLDHITEQTGLTWSKETRTVRRLFIESK